jgi:hypothetical protein
MKRPTVATVFGILHIVFGAIGVLGIFGIGTAFQYSALNGLLRLISIAVSALLLVAGIFLVMNKKMAVDLSRYYCMASLAITVVYAVYLIAAFGMVGFIAAIVTILIGVIYPVLVWLLLVNNAEVKGFYAGQAA